MWTFPQHLPASLAWCGPGILQGQCELDPAWPTQWPLSVAPCCILSLHVCWAVVSLMRWLALCRLPGAVPLPTDAMPPASWLLLVLPCLHLSLPKPRNLRGSLCCVAEAPGLRGAGPARCHLPVGVTGCPEKAASPGSRLLFSLPGLTWELSSGLPFAPRTSLPVSCLSPSRGILVWSSSRTSGMESPI